MNECALCSSLVKNNTQIRLINAFSWKRFIYFYHWSETCTLYMVYNSTFIRESERASELWIVTLCLSVFSSFLHFYQQSFWRRRSQQRRRRWCVIIKYKQIIICFNSQLTRCAARTTEHILPYISCMLLLLSQAHCVSQFCARCSCCGDKWTYARQLNGIKIIIIYFKFKFISEWKSAFLVFVSNMINKRTKPKKNLVYTHFYGQTWNACIKHDTAQCSSINHLSFGRRKKTVEFSLRCLLLPLIDYDKHFYLKNVFYVQLRNCFALFALMLLVLASVSMR